MSIEQTSNNMAKLAMERSILREYRNNSNQRIVYLNDNDEFQIQLFNPETCTVGAEISINGETLPGTLIIKPGERIWLERPMLGNNRKFKFETYTVEDSEAVSNAIKFNGKVEIRFCRERKKIIIYPEYHHSYGTYLFDTTTRSAKGIDTAPITDNIYFSSDVNVLTNNAVNSVNYCHDDTAVLGFSDTDNTSNTRSISARINPETIKAPEIATKETGRIGNGSVSNQEFRTVDIEFESYAFNTETIQILPMSQKPFTNSDLQKIYCVNCGRKLNPKFKYCPYCGTKCDQFFENND